MRMSRLISRQTRYSFIPEQPCFFHCLYQEVPDGAFAQVTTRHVNRDAALCNIPGLELHQDFISSAEEQASPKLLRKSSL